MLTKILFTLLVVIVVALIFRHKAPATSNALTHAPKNTGGFKAATIAYTITALVIAISSVGFLLYWQDRHTVINIKVINARGQVMDYQAYKQDLAGRHFSTIDGRRISLGDNDRMEILVPN